MNSWDAVWTMSRETVHGVDDDLTEAQVKTGEAAPVEQLFDDVWLEALPLRLPGGTGGATPADALQLEHRVVDWLEQKAGVVAEHGEEEALAVVDGLAQLFVRATHAIQVAAQQLRALCYQCARSTAILVQDGHHHLCADAPAQRLLSRSGKAYAHSKFGKSSCKEER